jgi:hypothetical protein
MASPNELPAVKKEHGCVLSDRTLTIAMLSESYAVVVWIGRHASKTYLSVSITNSVERRRRKMKSHWPIPTRPAPLLGAPRCSPLCLEMHRSPGTPQAGPAKDRVQYSGQVAIRLTTENIHFVLLKLHNGLIIIYQNCHQAQTLLNTRFKNA